MGYDYHNGNTYELCSNNLLRTLDKGSVASQSAIALIIRTSDICCNQMVCKRLAGSQRILGWNKSATKVEDKRAVNYYSPFIFHFVDLPSNTTKYH